MAKIDAAGNVTGKLGPLVHYKLPGSDDTFIRTKPQVSKHALKRHPRYKKTREQNVEFRACVKAARSIAWAVRPVKVLGDHNSSGPLVRICKYIQQADASQPTGQRPVLFSQAGSLLNGFSFNNRNPFETLVRSPFQFSIARENGSAQISIPTLRPGVHLVNPNKLPFYRFVVTLGMLSDLCLIDKGTDYDFLHGEEGVCLARETEWHHWKDPFPATDMTLEIPGWTNKPGLSLVGGLGIAFGKEKVAGSIEAVKYAGAGKIWLTA